MAGQGLTRRQAMQYMAVAAAASQFLGFERWAYACGTSTSGPKASYKPRFFLKDDYKTLMCLVDRMIPADETPGALDAGAHEFIDHIIAHDEKMQGKFREAFRLFNQNAQKKFKKDFHQLQAEEQDQILQKLSDIEDESFKLARRYTCMGFFTSKIGMQYLDVPTLQHSYPASPKCPHHDDPEHRHLGQGAKS